MARCMQARKTAEVGAVTLLEPKVKVASQSVFYALRTRDGSCASGCGVSQTRVAEIVFGIEIVEWDLCSICLSRTGFREYFNSLPSATPREMEEVKTLLGIRMRRLKGNDSCCFSLESVRAVLSSEKLHPGDGEQVALDMKTY